MNGVDLAKGFESCRLEAYWDELGQCWTIGWGHTGKEVYKGLVWNQVQADSELNHDLLQATTLLTVYSPQAKQWAEGTVVALTDFVFNLGVGRYRDSTLRQLVQSNRWPEAKNEILKWDHSNGQVVPGLLRRRQVESGLIQT